MSTNSTPLNWLPRDVQKIIYGLAWEDLDQISQVDKTRRELAQEVARDILKDRIGVLFSSCFPMNFNWKDYICALFYFHDPEKLPFTWIAKLKWVVLEIFADTYAAVLWDKIDHFHKLPTLCEWMTQETVNLSDTSFATTLAQKHQARSGRFKIGPFMDKNPPPAHLNLPFTTLATFLQVTDSSIATGMASWDDRLKDVINDASQLSQNLKEDKLSDFQDSCTAKALQRSLLFILEKSTSNNPLTKFYFSTGRQGGSMVETPLSIFLKIIPYSKKRNADLTLKKLQEHPALQGAEAKAQFPGTPSNGHGKFVTLLGMFHDLASETQLQQIIEFVEGYEKRGGDINEYGGGNPFLTTWKYLAKRTTNPFFFREALVRLKEKFPHLDLERISRKGKNLETVLRNRCKTLVEEIARFFSTPPVRGERNPEKFQNKVNSYQASAASKIELFLKLLEDNTDPIFPIPINEDGYSTEVYTTDEEYERPPLENSTFTTPLACVLSSPCLPFHFMQKLRTHTRISSFLTPPNLPSPVLSLIANPAVPFDECITYLQIFEKAGGKIDEAPFMESDDAGFSPLHARFLDTILNFSPSPMILDQLDTFLELYCRLGGDINDQNNSLSCTPLHMLLSRAHPGFHHAIIFIFGKHGANLKLLDDDDTTVYQVTPNSYGENPNIDPSLFWWHQ